MEIPPATTEKAPCGKLGTAKEYLLRRHKHHQFTSCLSGFYSCEWRSYQEKTVQEGQCGCSVKEFSFFLLLVATFYLWFIVLYFWSESKNDYNSFDWFTYGKLGYWFLWGILILVVVSCSFSYFLLLVILAACLISERQHLKLHWTHKLATLFLLPCSFAAIIFTKSLWSDQWRTFSLSFQVTGPFLHLIAMLVMILLAWPLALNYFRINSKAIQKTILLVYLGCFFFLLIIPLGHHSACIMEEGTLGPKPGLIGHRGAPMLAPENTEMSFKKAALHGAYGFETDVTISFDGIPFIMHDKSLKRTTNVESLFPGDMDKNPAFFPWKHLEKLNAGNWFFENKPFFQRPTISPEDEKLARNQSVFKFSDFLKLAKKENRFIMFDLSRPPVKHPYYNKWINRTLEVILSELGDKSHLVLWLGSAERGLVMRVAPGFQHIIKTAYPIEMLRKYNIMKLNLNYRDMPHVDIRWYLENNITTNLWVVNEPWLFSLAWCSGAHSVTTDSIHTLSNLHQPSFLMTPREYRIMWTVTDTVAVLFISLIFGFHRWREKHIRKPLEQNLTEC